MIELIEETAQKVQEILNTEKRVVCVVYPDEGEPHSIFHLYLEEYGGPDDKPVAVAIYTGILFVPRIYREIADALGVEGHKKLSMRLYSPPSRPGSSEPP